MVAELKEGHNQTQKQNKYNCNAAQIETTNRIVELL